jgi:hypothetical protein
MDLLYATGMILPAELPALKKGSKVTSPKGGIPE